MTTEVIETQDTLHAGTVKNIATLIAKCDFPQDAFFLAEQQPQQVVISQEERQDLLRFARISELSNGDNGIDPARYVTGRIFCPEFELRWNQGETGERTQVVYIGKAGKWPDLISRQAGTELEQQTSFKSCYQRNYYLFGESLGEARLKQMGLEEGEEYWYYAEVRIPRLLRYPKLPEHLSKRRVQLAVCEYIEEETGSVNWFRFQDLKVAE